jgi:hypothetical protein
VGGAHNDTPAVALALAGLWLCARGLAGTGGGAFVAAAAVKAVAALPAPFAMLEAARSGAARRLAGGALAVTVALCALALAAYGTAAAEALDVLGSRQERISRYSVPATLARVLGADVDVMRAIGAAGFALVFAWLLVRCARGMDAIRAAGWATLALLCASAYVTPWYVLWLLPLAAVGRDRALLAATLALCALQLPSSLPL